MDQMLRKRVEDKIQGIVGKKKYRKKEQLNRQKVYEAYNAFNNVDDITAALLDGFPEVTKEQMRDIVENTNFFHRHENGAIILDQRVWFNDFLNQVKQKEMEDGENGTLCISNRNEMHVFDYVDKKFVNEDYLYDHYRTASIKSATVRKIKDKVEWSITIGGGKDYGKCITYDDKRKREKLKNKKRG